MPIRAVCPNAGCGKTLTVGDQFAGRKGKCPACGTMVDIPGAKPMGGSSGSMPRARPAAVTRMARPIEQEAEWEVIEDEPPPPPPPKSKVVQAVPIPAPPPRPAKPVEPEIVSADEVEVVDVSSATAKAGVPVSADPPRRRDDDRDDNRRRRDDDDRDRRDRRRDDDDYDRPRRSRDDELDDVDDRRRSRDEEREEEWKPKWPLVRIGMLITFIGMCILVGGLTFEAIFYLIVASAAQSGFGTDMYAFFQVGVMVSFLAMLPMLAGYVLGIFSHTKYNALGLAIATTAVCVVSLVLQIIFRVIPAFDKTLDFDYYSVGSLIIRLLVDMVFTAEPILYTLYVRAVYLNAKERDRADGCMPLVYLFGSYFGGKLLIFILLLIQRSVLSNALGYIIAIAAILTLGLLIGAYSWQLRNLWQARKTVRFRLIKKAGTRD